MLTFHAARIQDVATARHAIESGKLDMVGMTRAHLADPHIAAIPQVIAKSAGPKRKVFVVGAGPAGLQAARVADERGHEVVVFEVDAQGCGQVRVAAGLRRRREIMGIVEWRLAECVRLGVEIRCNAYAEAADVMAEDPDVVVVATGGVPNLSFLDAGGALN